MSIIKSKLCLSLLFIFCSLNVLAQKNVGYAIDSQYAFYNGERCSYFPNSFKVLQENM